MAEHLPPQEEIHVPGDAGFQLDEESGLYLPGDFEREDLEMAMDEFVAEQHKHQEQQEIIDSETEPSIPEDDMEEEEEEEEYGEEERDDHIEMSRRAVHEATRPDFDTLNQTRKVLDVVIDSYAKATAYQLRQRNEGGKTPEVFAYKMTTTRKIGEAIKRRFADKSKVLSNAPELGVTTTEATEFNFAEHRNAARAHADTYINENNIGPEVAAQIRREIFTGTLEGLLAKREGVLKEMAKEVRNDAELYDQSKTFAEHYMSYADSLVDPAKVHVSDEQLVYAANLVRNGFNPNKPENQAYIYEMQQEALQIIQERVGISDPLSINYDISWVMNFIARQDRPVSEIPFVERRNAVLNQVGYEVAVRTRAGYDSEYRSQISSLLGEDVRGMNVYNRTGDQANFVADAKYFHRHNKRFNLSLGVPDPNNRAYGSLLLFR